MSVYLVVDGGGSKTDFLLFNSRGESLATCRTAGTNAFFIDEAKAARRTAQGIGLCLSKGKIPLTALSKALLFIPGFEHCLGTLKHFLGETSVELLADSHNAFYGALGSPFGVAAMGGTGSFAMAQDRLGNSAVVGGWGPLIGDEGGGYHIGIMCLKKTAQLYDAEKTQTLLGRMVLKHLCIENPLQMQTKLYNPPITREKVASLCRVAEQAARQGDAHAAEIIAEAGRLLAEEAAAAAARVNTEGLSVTLTGGVSKMGDLIVAPFIQRAACLIPGCRYAPPKHGPLVGGALYLLHTLEHAELMDGKLGEQLEKSYQKLKEESLC